MRLLVGRIGRAHGILGEATIEVRTDEPDRRFAIGNQVSTDTHGDLKIISGRVHNGILLLMGKLLDRRRPILLVDRPPIGRMAHDRWFCRYHPHD